LRDHGYQPYYLNGGRSPGVFQQDTVDLILLDYKLPGMSGEAFFTRIKE